MLPEPDLFGNSTSTGCSSHDPLCGGITSNIDEVESLHSHAENGIECPAHSLSTLSLPRKKLKLVHSQSRGIPVYSKIFNSGRTGPRDERSTRRWYLVVIVLLYIGLLTSFSLNVSLLIRKDPGSSPREDISSHIPSSTGDLGGVHGKEGPKHLKHGAEFSYTTACLVQDPCGAGSYYSCSMRKCLLCPRDTYQNQWGQTACWPCPNRTHTDSTGCTSPQQCKLIECGKHSRPDLAVLQTPNYPNLFPITSSCHWRVRPAEFQTSLIIIPSISLPQLCTHTLNIRSQVDKGSGLIYETCKSSDKPLLLTAQSSSIYVDFQGKGNLTSQGFQISILSVSSEVSQVLEAVLSPDWERTRTVLGYSQKEDRLVARLLSLLSPGLRRQDRTRKHQEKPLIEVVEDTGHSIYLQDTGLHKNQDVEDHNQNHFQISQDKV